MQSNSPQVALPGAPQHSAQSAKPPEMEAQFDLRTRFRHSFRHMTKKRPKCAYCKTRFTIPERGRPPSYCCRGHRQRAYEQRRLKRAEGRGMPIKLLRTDIAALLAQRDFRDKVIAVLREVGLLPSKPGPSKGGLRLVKPAEPTD
jgi:hypothetical protein